MKITLLIAGLLGSAFYFRNHLPGFASEPASAPVVTFYGDGQVKSSVELIDGLRHGRCEQWYSSGRKECEGEYRAGLREGRWSFWGEDGSLDETRSGTYAAGKKLGA